MRLPKFKSPTTAVVIGLGVSGIVIGGVGYYIFKHHQSIVDDTDEGIGDEDSIVSEDEVERSVPLQRLASYLPENVISSDTSVTSTANHITPSDLAVTSTSSVTESNTPMTSLDMHITSSALSDLQDFDDNFNATETELLETPVQNKPLVPAKVLVLGLEGCGKSYMLNILAKTPNTGYTPTIGFNVVQIETDGYMLNVMEVGGGAKTRKYWSEFTSDMDLLIYMVDAGQLARFKPAKLELVQLLQQTNSNVPCLLIANKQDMRGAHKCSQIFASKDLKEIGRKSSGTLTLLDTTLEGSSGSTLRSTILSIVVSLLNDVKS